MERREFLRLMGWATAGTVVLGAGALAGCSTGPGAGGSKALTPGAAPPQGSSQLIQLSYLMPDQKLPRQVADAHVAAYQALMEKNGKPQRLKIRVSPQGAEYNTKVAVDAAGGALSDMVVLGADQISDLATAGYLLDLTPLMDKWDLAKEFHPIVRELGTLDGKLYVLGLVNTFTFFYRKDLLEKAGISTAQPKTWDELFARCDQIATKTGARPCGIPGATQWGGGTWNEGFKHVWLSFKGTIFDEKDKKWVVSSASLLKAFQVYETLTRNKWLTVDELLTPKPWEPIKYQEFPAGKTAIVTGGDWQWTYDWGPTGATPIDGLFDKVDRWMFPSEDGTPFVTVDGNQSVAISAKSKNPEAAFEYLKFINTLDEACRTAPIYVGALYGRGDMATKCDDYRKAANGKLVAAESYLSSGRYLRRYTGESKIAEGVARATEQIIIGKATAQQAMANFAKEMKDSLGTDAVKEA